MVVMHPFVGVHRRIHLRVQAYLAAKRDPTGPPRKNGAVAPTAPCLEKKSFEQIDFPKGP